MTLDPGPAIWALRNGEAPRIRFFTEKDLGEIQSRFNLDEEYVRDLRVVSSVLPFRINNHVLDNLIEWENAPDDPIFRIVFPHREMLSAAAYRTMSRLIGENAPRAIIHAAARRIRGELNPHPGGQLEQNRPLGPDDRPINGLQHKYRNTLLLFPPEGQTCHSFCTFCFRWAQFVGEPSMTQRLSGREVLGEYVRAHPELTDILVTGGDPMIMKAATLERYVDDFLSPALNHVRNIRFGTKALTFWPFRFTRDADADRILACFRRLVDGGKHVAIMAHVNHWRELDNPHAEEAVSRIRQTGAVIRSQTPFLRGINDDPATCAMNWSRQVELGIIPYYMFVARDTGAKSHFDIPLARAFDVFKRAYSSVSGLARTVRGPSMSVAEGKLEISGIVRIDGRKLFVLRFLQARDEADSYRMMLANYCEKATWIDELDIVDLAGAPAPISMLPIAS